MSDKTWREGAPGEPKFPDKFEVIKKAVLQVTNIETNRNKYYAIELHTAKNQYRVYTHYGRTDDLESNPNAGARESRYFDDLYPAQECYDKIYREKTSAKKGYKELSLASSKIGSRQSIGKSSGEIDAQTLKKMNEGDDKTKIKSKPSVVLPPIVNDLVSYLYSEATNALTSTVNAQITANGIETPLGVLTIGQIEKGQLILDELATKFSKKKQDRAELSQLSGDFYTVIPHKFGRSRDQALAAVIDTAQKVNDKQDTLQLMRDMLNVNGKSNVLVNPEIEQKYLALGCTIDPVDVPTFKKIKEYVENSSRRGRHYKVKNIWKIHRPNEQASYAQDVGNHKLLFHGSSPKNWVGILSRGLLLPKIVVSLGVHRTDAGWLGNGIYFGDAICTSMAYAGTGKRRTSFVTVASVALGKIKEYRKITYGINKAPDGFNSCHGVRGSEFSDDEFVVYEQNQQKLEYLVEI